MEVFMSLLNPSERQAVPRTTEEPRMRIRLNMVLAALALASCSSPAGKSPGTTTDGTEDSDAQTPAVAKDAGILRDTAASQPTPPPPQGTDARSPDTSVVSDLDAAAGATDAPKIVDGPAVTPEVFVGTSKCDKGNALLCEDFESGDIDATKWVTQKSQGIVAVETPKVPGRGKYALHVSAMNPEAENNHFASVTSTMVFPVAGKSVFVRAMVLVEAVSTKRHSNVIAAMPVGGGPQYVVNVIGSMSPPYTPVNFRWVWYSTPGANPEEYYGKPWTPTPLGKWACWEWEIRGASNESHFWVDGSKAEAFTVDAAAKPTWKFAASAKIRFGMEQYHAINPGFGIWFDDIAISDTRVGCGAPP